MRRNHSKKYACFAGGMAVALLIALGHTGAATGENILPLVPLGLPPVPIPANNPLTPAKVALGVKLFFDPGLSADRTVSCATCHKPDHFFADETPLSKGIDAQPGERNALSGLNAA